MRKYFTIIFCLLLVCCNSEKNIMDANDFTEKYFQVISKKYPEVSYQIREPLVINASYGESGKLVHLLDNAYRAYKLEPKDLDEVIQQYINGLKDRYEEKGEIDITRIVPIIKPSTHFDDLKSLSNSVKDFKVPELVWEKYNEDLIIVFAEDSENNMSYFNKEDFEKLNIKRDTLLNFSVSNLDKIVPEIEMMGGEGTYGLIAGGDYEASLILMKSIWSKENFDVDGEIVIALPNRDLVFITGSNNKEGIENLKKIAEENFETGNYNITKSLFIRSGDKFVKL